MAKLDLIDKGSVAGPIDPTVVAYLERRRTLDSGYRSFIESGHGAIPTRQYIKDTPYRVGRFLTLLDKKSTIPGPFMPHFDDSRLDCRVARSVLYIIDGENATSRSLFSGERLLPFAALYSGAHHPDEMCLDRAYIDFLCFDYGTGCERPPIVIWLSDDAQVAYQNWEEADCPYDDETELAVVDYSVFTARIADNFDDFLSLLQAQPSQP